MFPHIRFQIIISLVQRRLIGSLTMLILNKSNQNRMKATEQGGVGIVRKCWLHVNYYISSIDGTMSRTCLLIGVKLIKFI